MKNFKEIYRTSAEKAHCVSCGSMSSTIRLTLVNEDWLDGRHGVPSLKVMSWVSMEVGVLSGFWVCVANYFINHPEIL